MAGGALAGAFGLVSRASTQEDVGRAATVPVCSGQTVVCIEGEPFQCDGRNCFCATTTSGSKRCINFQGGVTCENRRRCDKNRNCRKGEFCIDLSDCEDCGARRGYCVPKCSG